jgi:hypothetical protein
MTGLKSGSGDDLWDDGSDEDSEPERNTDTGSEPTEAPAEGSAESDTSNETGDGVTTDESSDRSGERPYVVRRAIEDKPIQFEREERLTFFVHDDVVAGERDLVSEMESELGRDVPKFDVREAVYRAALQNQDDVLQELLEMGYTLDE